ncbi:MAG: phosphoenolpyruvate carboxylase, partial [Burkholderiales bacterium]|nr:phosphoenolpyruvate carboxylase [Opitutaceae bacterium]
MALKAASPKSTALNELAHLRAEVRALGSALGRVITRLEGPETLATVESLRALAKAARAGDAAAAKELTATVAALSPAEAFSQTMAFTLYFELVNLAEENFRILILRRRRAALGRSGARGAEPVSPLRESIESAVAELKSRGVSAEAMQALVDRMAIDLVFTAHPTESKRRTLLTKLRRLSGLLQHDSGQAPGQLGDPAAIEREIASLWLTDRSRVERPSVADEARTGMWYFDTTLYEVLPRLQNDLVRALARHYPGGVKAPARWLTFGSWIGGDRDGNPNVTAAVTEEVLGLHRQLAVGKFLEKTRELGRTLTLSDRREAITPELKKLLRENRHLSARVEALTKRYPHEPYRLVLAGMRERLESALARATKAISMPLEAEPLFHSEDAREILAALSRSLAAGRGAILAEGELHDNLTRLDVFGLHTAKLDLRQHSGPHEAAVAELLGRADYPKLPEVERRSVLGALLSASGEAAL